MYSKLKSRRSITYRYNDDRQVSFANLTDNEAKATALFLTGSACALLTGVVFYDILHDPKPNVVALTISHVGVAWLVFCAMLALFRSAFRYGVAHLLLAAAFAASYQLTEIVGFSTHLAITVGLVVAAYITLWVYPARWLLLLLASLTAFILAIVVTLAHSSLSYIPSEIAYGLWWGMLLTGILMLPSAGYVGFYPILIEEEEDRFEKAARGW